MCALVSVVGWFSDCSEHGLGCSFIYDILGPQGVLNDA